MKSKPLKKIYRCQCGRELQQASRIETDAEVVISFFPCPKCMDRAHDKGRDFDGQDLRGGHSR